MALDLRTRHYGPDHYMTSRSYDSIAELRMVQKRWSEAEQFLRKDLVIVERSRGKDHKYTAWVRVDLAETLFHQGRKDEARTLLIGALPLVGRDDPELRKVHARGEQILKEIGG